VSEDEDAGRLILRIAEPDDAAALMKLKQRLDEETSFMLLEPDATRPVVVYEPTLTGPHPFKSVVRPSSWYLTVGSSTEFRGTHWSSWGGRTAAGTGTMYVIDLGTRNEGHATLKLYDVRIHDGTRYFSRLRVSGAKTEDGVWDWCFNFPAWQATCQ
jgi:hypothetical protein